MDFSEEFNWSSNVNMYDLMRKNKLYVNVLPFITPPPPQDSPNHILNALSDELIQRVLGYLIGDIRDFLSTAEACKKFQENAKKCYPSIYKDFYIGYSMYRDLLPLNRVIDFLSIFGHLIRSINWDARFISDKREYEEYENRIFGAIVKFCGKKLVGLRMMEHKVDFNMGLQFLSLEELHVIKSNVDHFKPPPTLKKLCLRARTITNNLAWMSETYPNLSEISFYNWDELNDKVLVEFQKLNSQLTVFEVSCENVTSSIFHGIAMRLPNLTTLSYGFRLNKNEALQRKLEEDVVHLGELRQLKFLQSYPEISNCSIVDSLAAINAPIEVLTNISGPNPGMVESLGKLKTLKRLDVINFSASMVVDVVKKLPNLKNTYIRQCEHMSLNAVIQILENGRNLKRVEVYDPNMKIDSDNLLDSILDLARGRTKVVLLVSYPNVCVPLERLRKDIKWLDISYDDEPLSHVISRWNALAALPVSEFIAQIKFNCRE